MNLEKIADQLEKIQAEVDTLIEKKLELKNIVDIVVGEIQYNYNVYEEEPYMSTDDYGDEVTVRIELNEACIDVSDILEKVESELESQKVDDEVEELNEGTGTNETEVDMVSTTSTEGAEENE